VDWNPAKNFTYHHQFTTRLNLKAANFDVVDKMKIIGTILKTNLSWDDNYDHLTKKVNDRMQLLRGVQCFGATNIGPRVLEQSCVVWHSSLTQGNTDDLERTKKK
jgi:hypothetical protein